MDPPRHLLRLPGEIMTRAAAENLIQDSGVVSASGALNETMRLVQAEAPETVFQDYRKHTAEVMAAICLDLVKPMVKVYPDLDPGREEAGEKHGTR
jgi:hypothetical protein